MITDLFANFEPFTIKMTVLILVWISFIWNEYLTYRQYRVIKNTTSVPSQLQGTMDPENLAKTRAYTLDRMSFGVIKGWFDQILSTALIYLNGSYYLWLLSKYTLSSVTTTYNSDIIIALVFILIGSLISEVLSLPWSLYANFVIEERHGFNKYTPKFYAIDKIKKFILMQIISAVLAAAALKIVEAGGDYFFLYLWCFCFVTTLLLMTIYPDFIAPLFDKFVPLSEGPLKVGIEELASSLNYPLKKIFIVEGSKRSSHSNAYLVGFFKNKRIVLYDTLMAPTQAEEQNDPQGASPEDTPKTGENLSEKVASEGEKGKQSKGCSDPEIIAIIAHELGHWYHNHLVINIVISQVNLLLCFSVFALLYKNPLIYAAFGFVDETPLFIGLLIIFQFIFHPYNELLSFLMMCASRSMEYQADRFAKSLHKAADLRSALVKLNLDNLGFPVHDSLYSKWRHSHPTLLQRLDALGKIE